MARPAAISISSAASVAPPLPPWDRSVEVGFHAKPREDGVTPADLEDGYFRISVAKFFLIHKRRRCAFDLEEVDDRLPGLLQKPPKLFSLPPGIRMRIWRHVLHCEHDGPDALKPVRMNPASMLRPVWRDDQFDPYGRVISPAYGILNACFATRAEVMVAFFMTRRFHIVYSPHVGLTTSPLAVECVHRYGCLMRHVTVEIDFSKLSFGPRPEAAGLRAGSGILSIGPLVDVFAQGQKHRKRTQIKNLVVLCRRFCNPRPNSLLNFVEEPDFCALDGLLSLRSKVASARLVGFSEAYSQKLMRYLDDDGDTMLSPLEASRQTYVVRPSTFYPLMPGQRSWRDHGKGLQFLRLDDHDRIMNPMSFKLGDISRIASIDASLVSLVIKPSVRLSRNSTPNLDTSIHSPPRTRPTTPILVTRASDSDVITPPATPHDARSKLRPDDSPRSPRSPASPASPRSPLGRSRTVSSASLSLMGRLSRTPSIAGMSMRSKRESYAEAEPEAGRNLLRKLRDIGRRDSKD